MEKTTILVTGGAGYIGSHVCFELLVNDFNLVVIDSLENSTIDSINALSKHFKIDIPIYLGRLQDSDLMHKIFSNHKIDGVIHMAGFKSVKESVLNPDMYLDNNLMSTISLLKIMDIYNCTNLIFSSSATVYGDRNGECFETDPTSSLNPYGETKLLIEYILDTCVNYSSISKTDSIEKISNRLLEHQNRFTMTDLKIRKDWSFISLRYFNPIGAHPSLLIGENPKGIPENLVPYVMKVLSGDLEKLTIFGNDYDTPDGTAIRDYIHVVDLAKSHIAALKYQFENRETLSGIHERFNIGTGQGYSVLEVVNVFEKLIESEMDISLRWEIGPRRIGDSAKIFANSNKARELLNWKPIYGLNDMCRDAWEWWKLKTHVKS